MNDAARDFCKALAEYRDAPRLQRELEDTTYPPLTAALIAEVRRLKPKAKLPRYEADEKYPGSRYSETAAWAKQHIEVDAFIAPLVAPAQAEHARLSALREAAEERMEELGPLAVFERIPGARNVVYTDTDHRSQPHPGFYQRAACELRAAILAARGFEVDVVGVKHGSEVRSDAPPEVAAVLRYWRLDDTRLLATVGAANLKVLFHPMFPYAGYWDWPVASRERREDASFAKHRANEDAHLAVNRAPAPLPPPPSGPPPRL